MPAKQMFCLRCHTVSAPKKDTRGSFLIELFLWLMLIIPGVVYSLWRLTTKRFVCPNCGSDELVPPESPRARELRAS